MSTSLARPIDTARSCPDGVYDDGVVRVRRVATSRASIEARVADDGRLVVEHGVPASAVDDELGPVLAARLGPLTTDHDVFARAFTGLVLTSGPDADAAWELFYCNTLARLGRDHALGYSAIYRHALDLLPPTSVVDLGCSFGFLALHLAARGVRVTACDVDPGTVGLLGRVAGRLGHRVDVRLAGRGGVDLPDGAADAVALLHVLEHVPPADAALLLAEAQRLARRRVVVAVPYESTPEPLFGHLRAVDAAELRALGEAGGWPYDVHEHHGGWLVLDRPPAHHPPAPLNEERRP